jgi:hypothetical protein
VSHVIFRKQVSDGNYGTESAEVLLELEPEESAADMLALARILVHTELRQSPAWRVRDAVTPSELPDAAVSVPPDDLEDMPL